MTRIEFDINGLRGRQEAEHLGGVLSAVEGVARAVVDARRGRVAMVLESSTPSVLAARTRAVVRDAGYELASAFAPQPPWGRRWWFRGAGSGRRATTLRVLTSAVRARGKAGPACP